MRRACKPAYPNIHAPDVIALSKAKPVVRDRQSYDLCNKIRLFDDIAIRATLAVEKDIVSSYGWNFKQERLTHNQ